MLVNLLHPQNALTPSFVTLAGIVTLSMLSQPLNAASTILLTPEGTVKLVIALQL